MKIIPQTPAEATTTSNGHARKRRTRCRAWIQTIRSSKLWPEIEAPTFISLLIVFVGFGVGAAILALHIPDEIEAQQSRFHKVADEVYLKFQAALENYKTSGLWLHQACHDPKMTFEEYHEVYEYITATGLDFEAVSCGLLVKADDRADYENQTRTYFAENYPDFPYEGFTGYSVNQATGELQFGVSPNKTQYFVSHLVEPLDESNINNIFNRQAVDFDMETSQYHSKIVEQALDLGSLAVTERLELLPPPTDPAQPYEYCLTMAQPGLRERDSGEYHADVAMLVIRFMSLLEIAYKNYTVEDATTVYVFDSTQSLVDAEGQPAYFGGTSLGRDAPSVTQEFSYKALREAATSQRMDLPLKLAARQWTVVVVAYPGAYEADYFLAVFGALMIILASTCASLWIFSRSKARTEKATILLESAKRAAQAERELNDFISHEVRNPLSAAISANSFVSIAVNESLPLMTEETRQSIREDVVVVANSLQYINDLLRSMLDFHCALSNQINIKKRLVGIRHDVFDPVASMLYNRGFVFDVIIDCPDDLVVLADPLRLKQVILNLALNATKFVIKGFVRLKAEADDSTVTLSVEDSGPGIPTEKILEGNLFGKFQASLDSSSQGTGIGLSLCKHLVELMGGNIQLDESYDSGVPDCPGSRFVVTLDGPPTEWSYHDIPGSSGLEQSKATARSDTVPIENSESLSVAEVGTGAAATPPESSALPELLSVLFVDDDFILRKLFVRSVKRCRPNWVVSEAASGEAAIQLVDDAEGANSFDVVFMDQYMASTQKQLLGTEAARLLRSKGFNGIICGLSANNIGPQFIDAGADCFMIKPFPCESSELASELCRVLCRREKSTHDNDDHV